MKRFPSCPKCKSGLALFSTNRLHEARCDMLTQAEGCPLGFRRYFHHSPTDDEVAYIVFVTADFLVYHYYEGNTHYENGLPHSVDGQTHVYNRVFSRGHDTQKPIFILRDLAIDFDRLYELNRKFNVLNTFS